MGKGKRERMDLVVSEVTTEDEYQSASSSASVTVRAVGGLQPGRSYASMGRNRLVAPCRARAPHSAYGGARACEHAAARR